MPAPEHIPVVLLTQADCSLCDQAKTVLDQIAEDYPLRVRTVDLGSEEGQTLADHGGVLFPPGVLVDGRPFSYGRLSERRLRRELDRMSSCR